MTYNDVYTLLKWKAKQMTWNRNAEWESGYTYSYNYINMYESHMEVKDGKNRMK